MAAEFKKTFANAPQMAKELTVGVTSSLEQKDYAGAYQAINVLLGMPDLTKEQQAVAARALLTINGLVQKAKDAGDPKAAEALQMRRSTR
jgi:hypothetical protein